MSITTQRLKQFPETGSAFNCTTLPVFPDWDERVCRRLPSVVVAKPTTRLWPARSTVASVERSSKLDYFPISLSTVTILAEHFHFRQSGPSKQLQSLDLIFKSRIEHLQKPTCSENTLLLFLLMWQVSPSKCELLLALAVLILTLDTREAAICSPVRQTLLPAWCNRIDNVS